MVLFDECNDLFIQVARALLSDASPSSAAELSVFLDKQRYNFNFGSAHYNYDIRNDFPDTVSRRLERARQRYVTLEERGASARPSTNGHGSGLLEKRIRQMLLQETSLSSVEDQIVSLPGMFTREAMDYLLRSILSKTGGKVALPLPNWHFWSLDGCKEGAYSFSYFDAVDEEQLVTGFTKAARQQELRALILTSPAVPLMYALSEAAAKEIDRIALREGVEIVIDDVLRGVQPIGQRNSIARHFTKPYVIEGFSKRFGDEPLGALSYVLLPQECEHAAAIRPRASHAASSLFSQVLEAALLYSSRNAVAELESRNRALDAGLGALPSNVRIIRPSTTHLTTLFEIPLSPHDKDHWFHGVVENKKIDVFCLNAFYPQGYGVSPAIKRRHASSFRVTVGMMPRQKVYDGAKVLGDLIREYCRK